MDDREGRSWLDVGDPRSIDTDRLARDVGAACAASSVVIVEGLFARHVQVGPAVAGRFDVFVDLPADLRLVRKIERKCVRGGFPLAVLLDNYVRHRREAHCHWCHVEPLRGQCDLVVDGRQPLSLLAGEVARAASIHR